MIKKFQSVMSHDLDSLPPHKLSHTFSDPLPPLERDMLYGWPLGSSGIFLSVE